MIPVGSGAGNEGTEHIHGMQSAQVGKEMQIGEAGGDKGDFGGAQSCAPKIRPPRCQSSLEQELSKIFPSQNIAVPQDTAGSVLMSFLFVLPALYSSRSDNFPVTLKKRGVPPACDPHSSCDTPEQSHTPGFWDFPQSHSCSPEHKGDRVPQPSSQKEPPMIPRNQDHGTSFAQLCTQGVAYKWRIPDAEIPALHGSHFQPGYHKPQSFPRLLSKCRWAKEKRQHFIGNVPLVWNTLESMLPGERILFRISPI